MIYRNPNMDGTTIIIIYEPILRTQHIMDYWTEYTHTLTNPLHRYVILIQQVSVSIVTFFLMEGPSSLFVLTKWKAFFWSTARKQICFLYHTHSYLYNTYMFMRHVKYTIITCIGIKPRYIFVSSYNCTVGTPQNYKVELLSSNIYFYFKSWPWLHDVGNR